MRKIPTVFVRNPEDRRFVTRQITPGCEWVFNDPEAVPTRKYDGTCVMLDEQGRWWARREVKPGKSAPPEFIHLQTDEVAGKVVGWEPIEQSGFAKWHEAALSDAGNPDLAPGTYELIGPKVNGNPESALQHKLMRHDDAQVLMIGAPYTFDGLAAWLRVHQYEGVVWHHPDGRMAKLKKRDFPARH